MTPPKCAQDQQRAEVGRKGGGQREQGGDHKRRLRDLLAAGRSASTLAGISISASPAVVADTVRLALAAPTNSAAAGAAGLGAIDHGEGREAADEHRQVGAAVAGRTGLELVGRGAGTSGGVCGHGVAVAIGRADLQRSWDGAEPIVNIF